MTRTLTITITCTDDEPAHVAEVDSVHAETSFDPPLAPFDTRSVTGALLFGIEGYLMRHVPKLSRGLIKR
jgi:hypothetical protein